MHRRILCVLISASLIFSCDNSTDNSPNKFSDPLLVKLYDFKDRRLTDSLLVFINHENPEYRREAALAFASVQDSTALTHLGKMLVREEDPELRKAAAFAIGQTSARDSERILLGCLGKETDPSVLSELLEAYGKTTTHWQAVNPSFFHDTIKAEGLAWSIYRAGLIGKTDSIANRVAADMLSGEYDQNSRLGAAHYFSRSATNFEKYFDRIKSVAQKDKSAEVRMAALYSLRKIKTTESLSVIIQSYETEADYRIRVNAVRALSQFSKEERKALLYKALSDKQANVAIAASEVLRDAPFDDDWIAISTMIERIKNWRVRANLYEVAFKAGKNSALGSEIRTEIEKTDNAYYRAALLGTLQYDPSAIDFLRKYVNDPHPAVVRVAAASALAEMNGEQGFSSQQKKDFVEFSKSAIASGDPGVIGVLCGALSNKDYKYNLIVSDISFLKDARKKLSLPRDNESIQPLEEAIAFFEGRKVEPIKNEFNHPIDWEFVKKIPRNQQAVIETTRGSIRIQFDVENAPGSVENFIKLAEARYFDNKAFHRVVPNFVIQGGCKRGDGLGSEDYSIRSEFSHTRYKTGSVGMASAGKDTEGTQWFITHSPTPHLDGRYTIFAEVVEGIEVVHLMEVGDSVLKVQIIR